MYYNIYNAVLLTLIFVWYQLVASFLISIWSPLLSLCVSLCLNKYPFAGPRSSQPPNIHSSFLQKAPKAFKQILRGERQGIFHWLWNLSAKKKKKTEILEAEKVSFSEQKGKKQRVKNPKRSQEKCFSCVKWVTVSCTYDISPAPPAL